MPFGFSTAVQSDKLVTMSPGRSPSPDVAAPPAYDVVCQAIGGLRPALEARGVVSAAVFGSVARGDAGAGSDIDVLIDVDPATAFDLIDLVAVRDMIADATGRDVDVVERESLKKLARRRVLAEARRIF